MRRPALIACSTLLATASLSACSSEMQSPDAPDDLPPVRVTGAAENCISTRNIRDTRVQSDRVIDFEMTGDRVYRNTLPNRCPGLGFERAFSYDTTIGRLCNPEIIYVLRETAGTIERGAGCAIGNFVPVEYTGADRVN